MIILRMPRYVKEEIVDPFLKGKYSEIDRTYVRSHFKQVIMNGYEGIFSKNWMVLNKSPHLKREWESILGVELPEDAEVWSRPTKNEEVYNYKQYAIDNKLDPERGSW